MSVSCASAPGTSIFITAALCSKAIVFHFCSAYSSFTLPENWKNCEAVGQTRTKKMPVANNQHAAHNPACHLCCWSKPLGRTLGTGQWTSLHHFGLGGLQPPRFPWCQRSRKAKSSHICCIQHKIEYFKNYSVTQQIITISFTHISFLENSTVMTPLSRTLLHTVEHGYIKLTYIKFLAT